MDLKLNEQQAFERIAARCAKVEYCAADIRKKLSEWPLEDDFADNIVERLRKENYINEDRYCHAFVYDKWKINHWGKIKIRAMLALKHLPDEDIENALADIDEADYNATLSDLLKVKSKTISAANDYERYQKLIKFAYSHGFELEAIKKCLKRDAEQ